MNKTISAALAAATLSAGIAVPAFSAPMQVSGVTAPSGLSQVQYRGCFNGESRWQCQQRLRYRDGSYYRQGNNGYYDSRRYDYRNGRYYSRDDNNEVGAALIGGILGFALGAAISGNNDDRDYYNRNRNNSRYWAQCQSRYRSWDRNSGTYLGSDGYRHYCRL